ncbi:MAG: S26 family signal peptidase [Planctomycetota bacterium]
MRPARALALSRSALWLTAAGASIYLLGRFSLVGIPEGDRGMEPTFRAGERLLVDRRPGRLERGDVVLFQLGEGAPRVARLTAVHGDLLEWIDGRLSVNGRIASPSGAGSEAPFEPLRPGEALVGRDNPDLPGSEKWKRVPEGNLRGRVVLAWPF